MAPDPIPENNLPKRVKRSWSWVFYVTAALILLVLIAQATLNETARNPTRTASAELGSYGQVSIRFSTNPSPALPTGTVTLNFMPMNARGVTMALDGLSFDYGRESSDQPVNSGEAQLMPDGSGMFMGNAQFPTVGNWWVRVKMHKGGGQAEVRFTVNVKPAQ